MSEIQPVYFWKKAPFIRLIIPFITGIIYQYYFRSPINAIFFVTVASVILFLFFLTRSIHIKYKYRWLPGITIHILSFAAGSFIINNSDICNNENWIGNFNTDSVEVLATLKEPLVEKAKTYKAEARLEAIHTGGEWKNVTGKILIYFRKDSTLKNLNYGSQVLFYKPLQEIKSSGNPGSFDYKQYNARQNIYHQVFLKTTDFVITTTPRINNLQSKLYNLRDWVIQVIQKHIKGEKEVGIAEALLIGYREDLDKSLVQAYSNTGVVHIIAISGLHLGMIYAALNWILRPLKRRKGLKWTRPVIIFIVLWLFTFLAGAVPSIMRSAVMFSFIILGDALGRKNYIYNTLAASAFVMLCVNPFYLWDVGFQLSYAAVISILIFQTKVYNWFYIQNKALDFFWKLISVTIAAQILTTPLVLYTFHQFPLLFLITNLVIVPLSSAILFLELGLVILNQWNLVADLIGATTTRLLTFMNSFVEYINNFSFAVYDGVQNNLVETVLLYIIIIAISYWLINKTKISFFIGLAGLTAFVLVDAIETITARRQEKIIVYNIPQHYAIDFILGKSYAAVTDTALLNDFYLSNYNLKPSRVLHQVTLKSNLDDLYVSHPFYQYRGKRILIIDRPFTFDNPAKITVDIIIVSQNPRLYIADLARVFDCNMYVFDASNSPWKINQWKKDCENLHLRHYITAEQGAFVYNFESK